MKQWRRLIVAALLFPNTAAWVHGYTTYAKWGSKTASYYINPANNDVSADAAEQAIQAAVNYWPSQSGANVTLNYLGRTTSTAQQNDGKNIVFFRSTSNGSAVGSTYSWWSSGNLVDSDVIFWDGGYTFFTGTSGCSGGVYLEDIAAHEMGHFLGMEHSQVGSATMYPSASYCGQDLRQLDADDIAGILTLYPAGSSPIAPGITQQPQSQTVAVGASATFNVGASGTAPLTYQWQSKASGASNFSNISGASGSSYTTPGTLSTDNGKQFRCVVSNSAGSATSGAATLTVTTGGPYTCMRAARCDGFIDYGAPDQILCATDLREYLCTAVGWTGPGASCTCGTPPPPPIDPPVIQSGSSANGQVGVSFGFQVTASNSPTSFSASGLPSGLAINTTSGLISGVPLSAGTFTTTVSATNSSGTGSKGMTLTISAAAVTNPPVITSGGTASGSINKNFSYQIIASNSPTSYGATGLPSGLTIQPATGKISGITGTAGTFNILLSASNAAGTGTKTLTLTISTKRSPHLTGANISASGQSASAPLASPSNVVLAQGAETYVLRAEGTDLAAGDILQWNGSGITTTLADTTQLAAVLPGTLVREGSINLQVMTTEGELSEPYMFTITLAANDLAGSRVYPNPWRADRHNSAVQFDGLPIQAEVKLFTVSGHWIRTLPSNAGAAPWDLNEESGKQVASGLYLYLITTPTEKKTGQLVVIR